MSGSKGNQLLPKFPLVAPHPDLAAFHFQKHSKRRCLLFLLIRPSTSPESCSLAVVDLSWTRKEAAEFLTCTE